MKYYINKNGTIVINVPRHKHHPIKTLMKILNQSKINTDGINETEVLELGQFIKSITAQIQENGHF